MGDSILFEVVIVLLLIILNGLFAGSELAMVSSSKSRLKKLALGGSKRAVTALKLSKSPNTFLSTVQIGITLIGIFAGAFGGATISVKLTALLNNIDFLVPYSETLGFLLVVIIITYLSLVIGELVPKRLAINNPEALAMISAKPMSFISVATKPFIWILSISTEIVLKILNFKPSTKSAVSAEEIKILVEEGTKSGVIDEMEKDIIERVFKAGDLEVSSIMKIRQEIVFLNIKDTEGKIVNIILKNPYSRYPVIDGNFDNVLGFVNSKEVLKDIALNDAVDLKKNLMPIVKTPEETPVLHMLDIFKKNKTHIVIVTNEYGGTEGLITQGDVIDSVVGEIEGDEEDDIIKIYENEFDLKGTFIIEDLKELIKENYLPNEEDGFKTVAGLVMTNLEEVPEVNDEYVWKNYKFKVMEMKGNRILKIKLYIS